MSRFLLVVTHWLKTQLFNFWASYTVVYSESFNFYFMGFWASKVKVQGKRGSCLRSTVWGLGLRGNLAFVIV